MYKKRHFYRKRYTQRTYSFYKGFIMYKRLFVIFLALFFSQTQAMDFPGMGGPLESSKSVSVRVEEPGISVRCGVVMSLRDLAVSASSSPASSTTTSPETERRALAALTLGSSISSEGPKED